MKLGREMGNRIRFVLDNFIPSHKRLQMVCLLAI